MTKQEIEKIYLEMDSKKYFEKPFNMIAIEGYNHNLGKVLLSEDKNLCIINSETKNYYIGICGFGFVNFLFPKSTTRDLTEKEFEQLNKFSYSISYNNYNEYQLRKREGIYKNENSQR